MEHKKNQERREPTNGEAARLTGPPAGDFLAELGSACRSSARFPDEQPQLTPLNDARELPAELRELVDRMMTEGATFEDVYEALAERGGPLLSLQGIQNYYRGNLDVQRRRVQYQVERARQLRDSFANPESAEAQLAQAAILTGLQCLTRKGSQMTVRETLQASMMRENLQLKRRLAHIKVQRDSEDERYRRTKHQAEMAKLHFLKLKIQQLRRLLLQEGKDKVLGPEAMEKIQEIYGVLRLPVAPRDPDRKDRPTTET